MIRARNIVAKHCANVSNLFVGYGDAAPFTPTKPTTPEPVKTACESSMVIDPRMCNRETAAAAPVCGDRSKRALGGGEKKRLDALFIQLPVISFSARDRLRIAYQRTSAGSVKEPTGKESWRNWMR